MLKKYKFTLLGDNNREIVVIITTETATEAIGLLNKHFPNGEVINEQYRNCGEDGWNALIA